MLACVRSAMLFGVEGLIVDVQVHVSTGLPSYTFVGLPDAAVREARDRVRAALLSSGLSWPQRRVTVNLAPSGVRKSCASWSAESRSQLSSSSRRSRVWFTCPVSSVS